MRERAFTSLNLNQYSKCNLVSKLDYIDLNVPKERQYILRMLIKKTFGEYHIPDNLLWIKPMLDMAIETQKIIGIRQPFVYITIRNGLVTSETVEDSDKKIMESKTYMGLTQYKGLFCKNKFHSN